MSVILGVFGGNAGVGDAVQEMLRRTSPADDRSGVRRGDAAVLAVSRPEWQMAAGMASGELVAEAGDVMVVADASLYHLTDLRNALGDAGVPVAGQGPGHLIAAAYRAWGETCVDRLEGDWAFILWDRRERLVLCARDFGGRRALYYSPVGDALVICSTISGVLAHPATSPELNPVALADSAAAFMASSHETCFRGVRQLLAGHTLRWREGDLRVIRHWNPAPREDPHGLPFEEAALHLRDLLSDAVRERLSSTGPTSIQLSGGWDSTAIYGAGQKLLSGSTSGSAALLPVSISYPPGDPGREDEIIQMILDHWNSSTEWIDSRQIPLFQRPEEAAAGRDEPFAHVYEYWNRRLAQAGRSVGSRVMFDGFGGDSLFQSSPSYFSDLLRRGHLLELRREWKAKGMRGVAPAIQWCIQPLLPTGFMHALSDRLGGMGMELSRERKLPSWIDRKFAKTHAMVERERRNTPRYGEDTATSDEIHWHLTNPWISRMLAENYALGLAEGVELRSPLFDRRVVEFAMSRPWHERSYRRQTKRLLRRAVQGLLPDDVLAPRRYRTGMTTGFFERHMRAELPRLREDVLRGPVLAELGIVDPTALNEAVDRYLQHPDPGTGVQIFFTLSTELWLRSRRGALPRETPHAESRAGGGNGMPGPSRPASTAAARAPSAGAATGRR